MLDGPFATLRTAYSASTKSPGCGGRVVVTHHPRASGALGRLRMLLRIMEFSIWSAFAALESAALRLTVSAVAPGWKDTEMRRGQLEAREEARHERRRGHRGFLWDATR